MLQLYFAQAVTSLAWRRLIGLSIIIATVSFICRFFYNVWLHPLANYPGPLMHCGTSLPKNFYLVNGTLNRRLVELHSKYGPVVRIAPRELSYISVDAWTDIHCSRPGKKSTAPSQSQGILEKALFGSFSLLWLCDREHARHRRIISPAFSNRFLDGQEAKIRKHADKFVEQLRNQYQGSINISEWFSFATFDIIGDLIFSEPFDCLQNSEYHPWIRFIFSHVKMMTYVQILAAYPFCSQIMVYMIPLLQKTSASFHVRSTIDKVSRRRNLKVSKPDMMSYILKSDLSFPELHADTQILVMAGSETSATLLSAAMFYLLRNEECLHRACNEVRMAFRREDDMTTKAVSKLSYLQSVINESLRIHPPLPMSADHLVPEGGALIDGKFVPGNSVVQTSHWATYHSERNFRHPNVFQPERWHSSEHSEGSKEYVDDVREIFHPFSLGHRSCIGRDLANLEVRYLLARVLWNFDLELSPYSLDWSNQKAFLIYEKKPLIVTIKPADAAIFQAD